ncbi:hypothetical protein ACFQ0M_47695 [Kitasatospora aburaviensis]
MEVFDDRYLLGALAAGAAQDPRCYVGIIAFEDLGLAALDALGVPFSRMAVVDAPGPRWPDVVAAMAREEAFGVLLLGSTEPPGPRTHQRIAALLRESGTTLLTTTPGPAPRCA